MDPLIGSYPNEPFGPDLRLTAQKDIAFQSDMSKSVDYDQAYFDKYVSYEDSVIAHRLNEARVELTEKYCTCVVDVGIGSGEFIKKSRMKVYGCDINPAGVDWLKERNLYVSLDSLPPEVNGLTFWDSLEHMPTPSEILSKVPKGSYIFVSIPIFHDLEKVRQSKHFRPNEHYYYYTPAGLNRFVTEVGYEPVEANNLEEVAGRESIGTFVFRRK